MGLSIKTIKNAVFLTDDYSDDYEGFILGNANGFTHFKMKEGVYEGEEGHSFGFPYSYYNRWRDKLCAKFLHHDIEIVWKNTEEYKDKPFFELINHGDNSGDFDTDHCAKLYKDFSDHIHEIDEKEELDFFNVYLDFTLAFSEASKNNGVVHFT